MITCDSALKQFIKYLDEKRELGARFIFEELDESSLFVDKEFVPSIEQKIDAMMDQLTTDYANY